MSKLTKHFTFFDGLRAIAVFMVIAFHCNIFSNQEPFENILSSILQYGNAGVDLFFVLSGFLITRILVLTRSQEGRYKKFFARRAIRIFPLYYFVLIGAIYVLPLLFKNYIPSSWEVKEPLWYFLYLSNFYIGIVKQFSHGIIDVSWSLAIEEQFYLFWPFLVFNLSLENLKRVSIAIIISSILIKIAMVLTSTHPIVIYTSFFSRVDAMCWGALIGIWDIQEKNLNFIKGKIPYFLGFFIMSVLLMWQGSLYMAATYVAKPLFFTILLLLFLYFPFHKTKKILECSIISRFGKLSYGIYLFHNPINSLLKKHIYPQIMMTTGLEKILAQLGHILLTALITYLIAEISWRLIEAPFMKFKKHFAYERN